MKLNNGTNNKDLGQNSIAIGHGCIAVGKEQTVLGKYPDLPTQETSTDALIIGGGKSEGERYTALRVTQNGEVLLGGNEVFMTSPDTGEIIQVYMTGSNNRLKKAIML